MNDPKEFERVLQERQRAKKLAQAAAAGIRKAVDQDGKVRVWHFIEKRWKQIWPVDAAEQIRLGIAALEVVEMAGPQGAEMVAIDQVQERQTQGWQVVGEEPAQGPPPEAPVGEPTVVETEQAKGKRRSDRPAK